MSSNDQPESATERIDARIVQLSDGRGEMLARIRHLIHRADPHVVEDVKWVKITFAQGASLQDPNGQFNASLNGNTRRAIDLREGDELGEETFTALVRAAVDLNAS